MTCKKGTLRQVLICLKPLPSWVFVFMECCSNFVGSESDQKQSAKLLQNMVSNTTQHNPTLSQPHNVQGVSGIDARFLITTD